MEPIKSLPELISRVADQKEIGPALDLIAQAALELTSSRHTMIAILDEEEGVLKVKHGAGEEFLSKALDRHLNVDLTQGEGIIAYVAATRESVRTGNVGAEPRYRALFSNTVSEFAVPVLDNERRIRGVLNIESDRADAFGDKERAIGEALAGITAMVLERSDFLERESALIQIGQALDNSLTEEVLIEKLIHVAEEVLRFQACSVFLHDAKTDRFVLRGSSGSLRSQVGELSYTRGEGITGWVCDTGQAILLHEPQNDPRWRGKYVEFPSDQIASFLAVPIVFRNRSIGAIRALRRKSDNPYLDNRFNESDQDVLLAIAEQVASGLENLRNMERIVRSERMIAWGELSAKSSHMIGNRVFALKGDINELAHVLSSRAPDIEEIRGLQKSLAVNVTRIEEILQDFRDFLTATQLKREPVNVNALIEETVDEVFPRLSQVEMKMDLAMDLPEVLADGKKLRRAISELIENALNYIQQGKLAICTRLVGKTEHDETRLSHTSNFVQIEVEDSGPGIADEAKSTIFQPFFSQRVKGMGLGLSIVKGIVDAHGGEVFETGRPGHGARFVILLPLPDRP
ncbi:MAG TPA: GAF domain-containing protein [Fimbriimonadaceae bacterium]|nr:GAF domain-containing protein [Fimbriimonadaceae bacterium]